MGCSPLKSKATKVAQLKKKLNPRLISTMSRNSTINRTESSLKVVFKKCLRFEIFEKTPKFALNTLDLSKTQLASKSLSVLPLYNKLKTQYSHFSSAFTNFYVKVHSTCIPKCRFFDCLQVFMLSLLSNECIHVRINTQSPYLEVSGLLDKKTLKVFEAWQELEAAIEEMKSFKTEELDVKLKEMKELQGMLDEYSEFVLKPWPYVKAGKLLKSALETFQKISVKSQGIDKEIQLFFTKFDNKNLEKKLKKFSTQPIYSCKQIVHLQY